MDFISLTSCIHILLKFHRDTPELKGALVLAKSYLSARCPALIKTSREKNSSFTIASATHSHKCSVLQTYIFLWINQTQLSSHCACVLLRSIHTQFYIPLDGLSSWKHAFELRHEIFMRFVKYLGRHGDSQISLYSSAIGRI